LSRVNLTFYHVAETLWWGSGSATCYGWMWKVSM